ncbi:uncharacterized protein LOC113237068 [Hyposmocoma kahamanoa]|uniref:uncharacterized protein LOC113237068 n=1 Tax=Hyposmocoma kahamanoa TaxID=1477025 RepID=UPI000E6D71DC|nr:uncharacterized protein LOC113237068 [Hyposmocoma kahamanoa]
MERYCLRFFVLFFFLWDNASTEEFTTDAIVGASAELPCNVTAGTDSKLDILVWYRNGSSSAFYSQDMRNGDDISSVEGRYSLIISEDDGYIYLLIKTVKPSDAGGYYCLADFTSSPGQKTYTQLNVIEPPVHLWVIHENGSQVATANASANASEYIGPYYVGETVRLFCVSFGGNPRASLVWFVGQKLMKETSTPISEQRTRSDVEIGPLSHEDHGLVISCQANNNNLAPPLSIDAVVDMHLPPELISVRDVSSSPDPNLPIMGGGRTQEGQILQLQCRVFGARPYAPQIKWRLNDEDLDLEQIVTVKQEQKLVVSEIKLLMDHTYDEASVTCCAPANKRGEDAFVCAQSLPLIVLYAPVVNITVNGDIKKIVDRTYAIQNNSNISIYCDHKAHPSETVVSWFHIDHEENVNNNNKNKNGYHPVLNLYNVTEEDAGEYVCSVENVVGKTFGDPVTIDVVYRPYCIDETTEDYGIGENDFVNLTCKVKGNPESHLYRWVTINEKVNLSTFTGAIPFSITDTESDTLLFQRPNGTETVTVFCNGINNVDAVATPCVFWVTDKTFPLSPTDCKAVKMDSGEITISCMGGHDGGLPQKFEFNLTKIDSNEQLMSIVSLEPKFIIQDPKEDNYKFVIRAINEKGPSQIVEIVKEDILNATLGNVDQISAVTNITTLALALCAGVALIALAACGLVLCAQERSTRLDLHHALADPPLCAYNAEGDIITVTKSNYDIYNDSDESECNVRRTESFRRAMARYPSKNFDVKRTSSFHSARYMDDLHESESKINDVLKRSGSCRVHSLQNISRKREMDALCDHLVMRLPPETNYQVAKPMNSFYTIPRKAKTKSREISDEVSEITQASDFSLPPPPDEFGTYRAATRIKDIPSKATPMYTTIRKNSTGKDSQKQQYNTIPSMNTVGVPTISGQHHSIYSYPDDDHRVNTNPFDEDSH